MTLKKEDEEKIGSIVDERLTARDKRNEIAKAEADEAKKKQEEKENPSGDQGSSKIEDPHCGNCNSMVSEGLDKCPSCGEPLEW